jgi:hypothetical protein
MEGHATSAKRKVDALIFVYDANSGKVGAFLDSAKKALMVGGCALCTITHGMLGEKSEWRECREEIGVPIQYYHRNELYGRLKELALGHLPCILAQIGSEYMMLLEPEVLQRCRGDVQDLKGRINYYLSANNLTL